MFGISSGQQEYKEQMAQQEAGGADCPAGLLLFHSRWSRVVSSYELGQLAKDYRLTANDLSHTNLRRNCPILSNVPIQFRCSIDSCKSSGTTSSS